MSGFFYWSSQKSKKIISSSSGKWNYDVFLSFRGIDTRNNFLGHLHAELINRGIHTFKDDEDLRKGDVISPVLLKSIRESRISIILFSENYASSSWCLDELVHILDCKKEVKQFVLPVFCDVQPTVLRNLENGRFGVDIAELEKKSKYDKKRVNNWKKALEEAAGLAGLELKKGDNEHSFLLKIIEEVSSNLNPTLLHVADHPVGLNSHIFEVKSLLDIGSDDDVRMIGIHGIGGIGKTTLAKAVYNSIAGQFEGGMCFLGNVREKSIPELQEMILFEILREKNIKLWGDSSKGIPLIKNRLSRKKVLLVIDDVDNLDQLNQLAGNRDWFGDGSRIIITTRNKCLLVNHDIVRTYEMKLLNDHAALQLLNWHAFKNRVPPKSTYADITKRVVGYAKGLPLALEKIGSGLSGKSVQVWESTLHQYETHLKREIFDVLERSYAKLEANEKKLFLDIACFFEGETLECVEKIYYACGFPVDICIDVLQEKSLVTIDKHNTLRMHDMVRHMGKEIVRQESIDPMKRSRLWFHEEVLQVIKENKGTDKIEGIKLDLPKRGNVEWNKSVFKKMKNLRILIIRNSHFSEEHKHLPDNLRLLEWQEFPFNDFPNKFSGEKLVILRLNRGSFKLAAYDLKKFQNLMIINLNGGKLWEVPDLSGIPNLRELHLDGCKKLIEIHDSVGHLENLVRLSAESCSRLETFPPNIKLPSLKYLNLQSCTKLEVFPNVLEKMENISWINICGTAIVELPSSIENLVGLKKLKLSLCRRLKDLLPSICKLENLYSLELEGCQLVIHKKLLEGSLSTLTELNIRNCFLFEQDLHIIFSCFRNLKMLDLSGNMFVRNSDCILKLGSLECIRLNNCKQLQHIPEDVVPRLKIIDAFNCTSLSLKLSSSSFSQELKEVRLPGTMTPKGFHHREGNSVSFFVGKKLPKIIVAFVFALKDIDLHNHNQQAFFSEVSLLVDGIKVLQTQCQMHKVETDHLWLFDLRNYFSKEEQPVNLESYLEDGWNNVEVSFQSQSLTAKWCGVHAYKNGSEDVSFRSLDALQKYSPAHPSYGSVSKKEKQPQWQACMLPHWQACMLPQPVSVRWRYDVFLSFRGADTLKTFTSHLFDSLADNGIIAFRDEMEVGMGELISQVPTVITESRISIVVLSENYASSTRCLDELVQTLECNKRLYQSILPVFYDVDTTEVCHQSGRYEKAFRNHQRIFNMEEVQQWRWALTEVSRISGSFHHSKRYGNDASLIKEIVEHVLRNLKIKWNLTRQKEDVLREFPEKCPPRGSESVVVYTTSLGVIPPTLQACDRVKSVLDFHGAEFEERDLWADKCNEYLEELRTLLGGRVELPRVFVKGRYLGGVWEVMELNESGQFPEILRACSRQSGRRQFGE